MFCLMVGTAGLPHLLTRYYTTPTVAETRSSVAWSLVLISLLYASAPALAVLVKYEVMAHLVGKPFDALPTWMAQWSHDASLLSYTDVNGDGILQFSELKIGSDLVMLASPEIGGLPYAISVLVAAGGLAAALSTADGLLLTIGNALAHDVYFGGDTSKAQAMRRVMWSKFSLLVVALIAAYVAAQRPAGILYLVVASFSLAGAAFVPAHGAWHFLDQGHACWCSGRHADRTVHDDLLHADQSIGHPPILWLGWKWLVVWYSACFCRCV